MGAAGGFGETEIGLYHLFIVGQLDGGTLHRDLAEFQYVTIVGHLQCGACILFDQQNRHAVVAQFSYDVQDFLDDARRQSEAGFIQHQQRRFGHQCAADGQHLPLAAGQGAGQLGASFLEARE